MSIVYITAYPKSGTTWLTRLLGDALNSPTGGCMPSEDDNEIATEGQDRTGDYVVRKGHFVLVDNELSGGKFYKMPVTTPHRLNWRNITDEKLILLVRDPRDICVSGSYHWNTTPELFLERMIKGDIARCGRWDKYNQAHLNIKLPPYAFASVRYEDLWQDTEEWAYIILSACKLPRSRPRIKEAVERQSFKEIFKRIPKEEHKRNNLRKGIVGDWKSHFTPKMSDRIWQEFGWMMEKLGYER